jgi:hypothetical protein
MEWVSKTAEQYMNLYIMYSREKLNRLFPYWSFATGNQHLNVTHINGATVDTASIGVENECRLQKWKLKLHTYEYS